LGTILGILEGCPRDLRPLRVDLQISVSRSGGVALLDHRLLVWQASGLGMAIQDEPDIHMSVAARPEQRR